MLQRRVFRITSAVFLTALLAILASVSSAQQEETTAVAVAVPTTMVSETIPPITTTSTTTTVQPAQDVQDVQPAQAAPAAVAELSAPTTTTEPPEPVETHTAPDPEPVEERYVSLQPCGGDLPPCWVKQRESHGDYTAHNVTGCGGEGCGGAWQFAVSTWADYGGYHEAQYAPPDVQDAKARELWDGGNGCRHWGAC